MFDALLTGIVGGLIAGCLLMLTLILYVKSNPAPNGQAINDAVAHLRETANRLLATVNLPQSWARVADLKAPRVLDPLSPPEVGATATEVAALMKARADENARNGADLPIPAMAVVVSSRRDISGAAEVWTKSAGIDSLYVLKLTSPGRRSVPDVVNLVLAQQPDLARRAPVRLVLFYHGPQGALPRVVQVLSTVADVQLMDYVEGTGYVPGLLHRKTD